MITIHKIIKHILTALCIFTIIWSIKFITTQKWSNIDEYAHMDYIEKLAIGQMPLSSDQICNEIFDHTINYPEKSVVGKPLTRSELGLANYSYQAQHPPLYYSVLLAPNMLMKKMNVDVFSRVIVLRLISYAFLVIGIFLWIPICGKLNKLGFKIPKSYAIGGVLFGLLVATHERYGIGNNLLSPLLINGSILLLLQYHLTPSNKLLYSFVFLMCLSVTSALTNLFAFPILFGVLFIKYYKNISAKNLIISISILSFFGLLFYLWKTLFVPEKIMGDFIQGFFKINFPANVLNLKGFTLLLMEDTFSLGFINKSINLGNYFLIFFISNTLLCMIFINSIYKNQKWLIIVLFAITYFILLLWYLSINIAGPTWVSFRHYLGLIPLFYLSCTSFLIVPFMKRKTNSAF